jgi:hypothetical protein
MSFFSGIKNTWKHAEYSVFLQGFLDPMARTGSISVRPDANSMRDFSTLLTDAAWQAFPEAFDGRFGQRPHKISAALTAMASGLLIDDIDRITKTGLSLGIYKLISAIEANADLYPFSTMDWKLIGIATAINLEFSDNLLKGWGL